MEAAAADELGPIDYLLIEWSDTEPTGEAAPLGFEIRRHPAGPWWSR